MPARLCTRFTPRNKVAVFLRAYQHAFVFGGVQLRAKGDVARGGAHPLPRRPLGVPDFPDWCVRKSTEVGCNPATWVVACCQGATNMVSAAATDHISKIEARAGRHLIDQNFSRFGAGTHPWDAGAPLKRLLHQIRKMHGLRQTYWQTAALDSTSGACA